jgi:EpsI family protein
VPSRALIAGALAAASLGLAMHLAPGRAPVVPDRDPLVTFPRELAGWAGMSRQLDPAVERTLAADDYLSATYARADAAAPVDLFVAFYRAQAGGAGIHSPEVCLPTGGWEVSDWAQVAIRLGDGTPAATVVPVNRAVIRKGLSRQLVYYWFEGRGRRLTSDYAAKALTVWDAALSGRSDGALVRLVTPIGVHEPVAAAEARIEAFMAEAVRHLPRHVPE